MPLQLVLLPGMDGTGDLFDPLLSALPAAPPPLVLRYPAREPLDYPALEQRVRQALPAQAPFVLLAESFSGPLGAAIAAAPPPNLRGLVLCASFVRAPHPRLGLARPLASWLPVTLLPRAVLHHLLLGRHGTPALRAALDQAVAQVAPAVMRARLKAVMDADQTTAFAGVRMPLLYLQARHDRVVPPAAAALVARLAPQARIVDIDAPHCLLQAAPKAAAEAITGFLLALEPARQ
ncbi:alpha/beta fold hydrolase [Achromobacter insuavis]|uniref:alpha/beta fold hydrolase n=1 Tax=Achromobacter insuavis TaxID=1287735 RepID=UPI001F1344F3|nr:alpha/beta fold hydrolase [Achromobacter insuavis]